MDGFSGSASAATFREISGERASTFWISPTKRTPFRGKVLISRWVAPSSPTAVRAALMQLASAGFRDDPPIPHRSDEIVPAHHRVVMIKKIAQEVEYLRLDADRQLPAAKLALSGVESVVAKNKDHVVLRGAQLL